MAFSPSSPVTGGAQTGFTSPTYTLTSDTAPDATGRQYAITALGGTQTGATAHSASSPFTMTMFRPKVFKALGTPDPNTGVYYKVSKNTWKLIFRKGATPAANQADQILQITCTIDVPAGTDTYDAAEIRAAWSAFAGTVWAQSSGIGDSLVSGIL